MIMRGVLLLGLLTGVSARPSGIAHHRRQDRSIILSRNSTCNDLKKYQEANDLDRIEADMYDELEAARVLDAYIFDNIDDVTDNFVNGFATPYGVGQTFSACQIPDTCSRIDCNDLDDPDAPGTGPAYAILLSFANFNLYMDKLYDALNLGKQDWNGVQVSLQQTYWPEHEEDIFPNIFLVSLQSLAFVLASSAGLIGPFVGAGVGATAGLVSGVFGGIGATLSEQDDSLANLAEMETVTQAWYQNVFNAIIWANDNLTITGQYLDVGPEVGASELENGASAAMVDIIDHGQWVDYTDHPILNSDNSKPRVNIDDLKTAFYKYILGQMINYVWKEQGTFIIKYEMSKDDFDGRDWKIDEKLRNHQVGNGFFLYSLWDNGDKSTDRPKTQSPPGYDSIKKDLGPCDTACLMRSAADGFHDKGFGYNYTVKADDYYDDQESAISQLGNVNGARGVFNIPICDLTGSDEVKDSKALSELLLEAGASQGPTNPVSVFCHCRELKDKNGKKFKDFVPENLVEKMTSNCDFNLWGEVIPY